MSNEKIQSIIARCLTEPDFLDRIRAGPGATLRDYALDQGTRSKLLEFDFTPLEKFAGFIAKVQHNYLWEAFPGTLKLLQITGLQIPIFSSYNRIHQQLRANGLAGRNEKTRSFLRFLKEELEQRQEPGVAVLREVLAHEELLWRIESQLGEVETTVGDAQGGGGELEASWTDGWGAIVLSIRGILVVREFAFDPAAVLSALERDSFDPTDAQPTVQHLGYWGDTAARKVRVLALDSETTVLLAEIDGLRPLRTVIERTNAALGGGIDPEDFSPFFEGALREGLLQIGPAHASNEIG